MRVGGIGPVIYLYTQILNKQKPSISGSRLSSREPCMVNLPARPRDRAACMEGLQNAPQGGRGETLALAHRCSIIRKTQGRPREDASRGPYEVLRIMLKYSITKTRFPTPASSLLGGSVPNFPSVLIQMEAKFYTDRTYHGAWSAWTVLYM